MFDENLPYRALSKIFGVDLMLMFEDSVYVMMRKEHKEDFQKSVVTMRDNYRNSLIMGGAFGLALLLSLRRYLPGQFSQPSLNRAIVESLVLGGCLVGSMVSVVMGSYKIVYAIKKDYILTADSDMYHYMRTMATRYSLAEDSQVRLVLSE